MVERQTSTLDVAGSSPVVRSNYLSRRKHMKFARKCAGHPNRQADGKYRGIYLCSDCIKNVRRHRGTKSNRVNAVFSERYVGQLTPNMKIYVDYLVKLK